MRRARVLWSRIAAMVRTRQLERDLEDEIRAHLDLLTEEHARRGLRPADARAAALRDFGGVALTKERHRDARSFTWLDDAGRDLRHAARLLRRNPLFAAIAAASLAIGIGANATVFTVANALLLQPPPGVAEPSRLVDIGTTRNGTGFGASSYLDYVAVRARASTLEAVYAYSRFPQAIAIGSHGVVENAFGSFVTVNYFQTLGATPAVGRLFGAADSDQPGASPVVVLGHSLWTQHFNRDPAVVGRAVTLNGQPFTVIGVAAEGFHGTGVRALDLWTPLGTAPIVQRASLLTDRTARRFLIGARVNRGISSSQAAAEVDAIGRTLEPDSRAASDSPGLRLESLSPVPGSGGPAVAMLALLAVIVACVLVVACTNVAGLLLARAAARRQEMGLRLAIGAGRGRLIRQLLVETALLFGLGAAGGLLLARSLTTLLAARLPALPFPVALSLVLDIRVVTATCAISLAAALLSGLAPALRALKTAVLPGFRHDAGLFRGRNLRHALLVGQVACSIAPVIGAGLFVRALHRAATIDPGFDPRAVELASIDLAQAGYTDTTGPAAGRDLMGRVAALPGVQSASLAAVLPGGFEVRRQAVSVPADPRSENEHIFAVDWNIVEPGFFATLRTRMLAGRDFSIDDRAGRQPVAILSRTAAAQLWPGQNAVGKELAHLARGGSASPARLLRVVGVVEDLRASSLIDGVGGPTVYVPFQQEYVPAMTLVVRTTRGQRVVEELRSVLAALNTNLSITGAQTLDEAVAFGLTPQRVAASVSGTLGIVGLILAGVGIYGVTAYAVARRTNEIGIRMALGARRSDVVRMVLREGMTIMLLGAALGAIAAAAMSRALSGFLFGIPPIDPLTFGATCALFAAIGVAACFVPARRAATVDPAQTLRAD
jgi:predicted permease